MAIDRSQLADSVRHILLRHWDPLGVHDVVAAADEYDSYAKRIIEMLLADADQYALGRHLNRLERDSMGLSGNPARCDCAARLLLIAYHTLLLCSDLREILDVELAGGNQIVESSRGWPKDVSVFIRLQRPVTRNPPPGIDRRDVNDPHYWTAELYHHQSGHLLAW